MTDVATLGLSVESSQVDKGTRALNQLSNSAKRAEAAAGKGRFQWHTYDETVARLGITSRKSATASRATAAALNSESVAATKAASAMRMHAVAVNDNARRMGGSFSGLGAQFQDIGVTASMGMSPALIALQQGTQIAGQMEMAMQGGASAVGILGSAFKSLFSPVTFIAIVFTGLAAAGLQMVDWAGLAAGALGGLADAIEIVAPYAAMAAAGLALVYAPAIIGGIVSLIGLIGQLSLAALGLAASFAAANPAVAFVLGITAAVAAANIFRDELTQIFGVDIVGAAKTGVNYIIGSFFAAYEDIKFLWNNFPAIIGAAAVGAANATISAIEQMINGATSLLNGFIEKVNGALSMLPGGLSIGTIGSVDFGQIANPYADALAGAVGGRNAAVQGALSRDYLGEFGGAIAKGASAAADKLRGLAGSFGGVEDAAGKAGGAAGKAAKDATDPWKGLRGAVDKVSDGMKFARDVVGGFVSDLRSGLKNGEGFWESFKSAASNALDKIIDKLLNNMLDALFQVGSASGGIGGGGSLLGTIFGGIGKLFGFASGGYTGGGAASRVAGVVHGGEYVFSKKATDRIGVGALEQLHSRAKGYRDGGYVTPAPRIMPAANTNRAQPGNINVTVNGARGNQEIQSMVAAGVKQGLGQYDKGLPGRIGEVMERNG